MKKFLILGVFVLALLVGGTGCMNQQQVESGKNLTNTALAYLQEKYGQEFSYAGPWGNSLTGDHSFLATCQSLPGKQLVIVVKNYRSEDKIICDNYLAVKYEDETLSFLQSCVNEVFGSGRAFRDVLENPLSPDLPVDATMEDVLADTSVWQSVLFEVKESSFSDEEQVSRLADLLAQTGAHFRMCVVFLPDSEYGIDNYDTLLDRLTDYRFSRCANITKLDENTDVRWVEKE